MPVVQLPSDALRVGEPILFALRDKTGQLLVPRGTVVANEEQRQMLAARQLYVDEQDSESLKRAMAGKLDSMLRQGALLGQIAKARPDATNLPAAAGANATSATRTRRLDDPMGAWSNLQMRVGAVLRDPGAAEFVPRVLQLQRTLLDQLNSDPDDALFVLIHWVSGEFRDYSASHALLVSVLCELAARNMPSWSTELRTSLRCAALTMNVAIGTLQNQLATQEFPVTPEQRAQLDVHGARGAELMRAAGVKDELWLTGVEMHHHAPPGPLEDLSTAHQVARLVQRADIFAARMSPRVRRAALSGAAAAKAAYLDENGQPDPAGSTVIKATGLYPPGSLVKLRNGELAVVLQRGRRANEPVVAAVMRADGIPLGEPAVRNTRMPTHEVTGGVAPHEVKLRLNPQKLLKLV